MRKFILLLFASVCLAAIALLAQGSSCGSSGGDSGKSVYEIYYEAYVDANGSSDGVLTEEEWTDLFIENAISDTGISSIEIKCGDLIITYSDLSTLTIEEVHTNVGHNWNEGEITTAATCTTAGVKTYTCLDCGLTRSEVINADGVSHKYGAYEYDNDYHWRTCVLCGDLEKCEHSKYEDNEAEAFICDYDCGYNASFLYYSFKVTFELDDNVSVIIYKTKNYTADGITAAVAFSRDSDTGELSNDGDGQVNFEVVLAEGYKLGNITISPSAGYKNLKDSSDTGTENIYRITKITEDLTVTITSIKKQAMYSFSSLTDSNGSVVFSWESDYNLDYIAVSVTNGDNTSTYKVAKGETSWTYSEALQNTLCDFEFQPYYMNVELGDAVSCSRYYDTEVRNINFSKIEIVTQNYVWPTCDYVSSPYWGAGITNNNYVYSTVSLYNSTGTLCYSSSEDLTDYSGARIKIRGNTSAYSEKPSYKIKLTKKVDLLSYLIDGRDNGISYADKEWVLLNSGASTNLMIGYAVSELLKMNYTPAYSYVALYINGDYRGLYILCESVKQGNGSGDTQARCAVDDNGFIIEYDAYWWNEDLYFENSITDWQHMQYTFKYPDSDDIDENSEEYIYIRDYVLSFENALYSGVDSYIDFIDEESFAKWLLAHDILGSNDGAGSNIFLTKKDNTDDSKLLMGPLWDFDGIMDVSYNSYATIHNHNMFYFPELLTKESFMSKYTELFESVKDNIISAITAKFEALASINYDSLIDIENKRWNTGAVCLCTQKSAAIDWMTAHIEWLATQLSD